MIVASLIIEHNVNFALAGNSQGPCSCPENGTFWFYNAVVHPQDVDGMANSVSGAIGIGVAIGMSKIFKLCLRFSCDGQGSVRQAILYADRTFFVICLAHSATQQALFSILE